jgi:DNA sulfur modification protein DndB
MSAWQIPCLRGVVGDWVFYSALMSAEQISKRIETSKNIREAKSLEDFLQRQLKDRVKGIANYLVQRPNRFFNAIIVGVFDALPKWVQFDLSKAADELDMPDVENIQDSLGVLIFDGKEKMFAIDGQHRVEGIKIARAKDAETIIKDQFAVILVAHVDDKLGKVRTRRLFSDINKRAVPVSNGDKVVIDEDELNALVARKTYAEYPRFKNGKLIAVTETEKLAEGDTEHFANLLTLYTVNKKLRRLFKRKRGTPEYASENVEAFYQVVTEFLEFVVKHEPSYHKFFVNRKTSLAKERRRNANILFRPIGVVLLANLYSHFVRQKNVERLAKHLKKIKFKSPGGAFDRILWNEGKVEAKAENRTAAFELCLHLLGEKNGTSPEELQDKLRKITKDPAYKLPKPVAVEAA